MPFPAFSRHRPARTGHHAPQSASPAEPGLGKFPVAR